MEAYAIRYKIDGITRIPDWDGETEKVKKLLEQERGTNSD